MAKENNRIKLKKNKEIFHYKEDLPLNKSLREHKGEHTNKL